MYITLPSNSSMAHYPANTLTNYITKLHSNVELTGQWEIGLSEIFIPRTWYNIPSEGAIIYIACLSASERQKRGVIRFKLNERGDETEPLSVFEVQKLIQGYYSDSRIFNDDYEENGWSAEVRVPGGYYKNIEDLLRLINAGIIKAHSSLFNKTTASVEELPQLKYELQTKRIHIALPDNHRITFSETLMEILGLEPDQLTMKNYAIQNFDDEWVYTIGSYELTRGVRGLYKSANVSDINAGIHLIYIYCDLVDFVPVGDTSVPLLRIVNPYASDDDVMIHQIFEPARYLPLRIKSFQTVEVSIKDDVGRNIPFEGGKLSLTVHLRRAKHQY